jgi:potassium/chloride transporter 4/5/6
MGKKSKKPPPPIAEEEQKLTTGDPAANGQQQQEQPDDRPASQAKSHKSAEYEANMLLFTEDQDDKVTRPTTASFLSRIADLNSLPPTMDPEAAVSEQKKGAELGTIFGVYLPCIQNILGVILFIRMVWIVGTAGVPLAFIVVLICCMVTFTTSISLSAIATNGIVPAGGSYFMISRALGPEFGGAVGILFFLGTSVAGAMYITGAVEIILNYMYPDAALFGDFRKDPQILYHNIRVYGTGFVLICSLCVYIGVKFVSKVAPIALVCVILSILSIYGGIFINYEGTPHEFCSLGERIVASTVEHCTDNITDPESLVHKFCTWTGAPELNPGLRGKQAAGRKSREVSHAASVSTETWKHVVVNIRNKRTSRYEGFKCDDYFLANEAKVRRAIPGIQSGVLAENMPARFGIKGNVISYDDPTYDISKSPKFANILIDITTSFTMFVAIYFPSCTGILAGSNRSGDLADGQKSIPTGTLAAQLTTSFIYLSSVVLFGASFNNLFIRDKFGESMVSLFFHFASSFSHSSNLFLSLPPECLSSRLLPYSPAFMISLISSQLPSCYFSKWCLLTFHDRSRQEKRLQPQYVTHYDPTFLPLCCCCCCDLPKSLLLFR